MSDNNLLVVSDLDIKVLIEGLDEARYFWKQEAKLKANLYADYALECLAKIKKAEEILNRLNEL